MSNNPSNQPSIRVHAPPGGHSSNLFSTSEFEQSAANKKKHMESDIFGSKKDTNEPTAVTKPNRSAGNNIFGTDVEQPGTKAGTLAGQYKQTQMKSNIFGNDEPTSTRATSDKNKSDIFGVNDKNDQNKHAAGVRRVGYNPINGESYTPKENINANEKESEPSTKTTTTETGNGHEQTANKDNAEVASNEKTQTPAATNPTEKDDAKKTATDTTNGNAAQKNVHTSVRVFHPPGGRSNGPLW